MTTYYTYANNLIALTKARAGAVAADFTAVETSFGLVNGEMILKAPLASPALTGVPTTPTAAPGTNTTQLASTAFVKASFGDSLGPLTAQSLAVTGTAGAGFVTLIGQSSNPTAPAAGTVLLHSSTANGFTRVEQDNEAATNLFLGRDSVFIVKNVTGVTIAKGATVYVSGSSGNIPTVAVAQANSAATLPCVGLALDAIANNASGQVMSVGIIASVDTSAFVSGDRVHVSPTVAGGLTATRPSGATNYAQRVGSVLVSGVGNGSILVTVAPAVLNMETGTNAATWTGQAIVANSLAVSGTATAPTVAVGTNNTQIATMAALINQAFATALPTQPGGTVTYSLTSTSGVAAWATTSSPVGSTLYAALNFGAF